ncbi:hypothetical protein EWM64_g272 [Hericium alpestre]|uniref:Translin n=1 Tax=Hericium alpestre TaxID=135208 RepID=A0A4Z0ABJ5_9AGAM|nr:hypothetical protein EWM64_g272 [Hericium alpestre]
MASSSDGRPIHDVFEAFRNELDEHNDRRERLIKASRDVTIASKRVIFLLHRIMNETNGDYGALSARAAREGYKKLRDIQALFKAMRPELEGDRFWRYQSNVSPGLQEYIEALSFTHYLEQGTLISYAGVQVSLSDATTGPVSFRNVHPSVCGFILSVNSSPVLAAWQYFTLPVSDYLLGVSDLTGELMRFAISAIAKRGGRTKASEVCAFVRSCKADFEAFTPHVRDLGKKQRVTSQSLQKIEDAAYAVAVRSSEYDLPPELLDDIVSRQVAGYGIGAGHDHHGSSRKRARPDDEGAYSD